MKTERDATETACPTMERGARNSNPRLRRSSTGEGRRRQLSPTPSPRCRSAGSEDSPFRAAGRPPLLPVPRLPHLRGDASDRQYLHRTRPLSGSLNRSRQLSASPFQSRSRRDRVLHGGRPFERPSEGAGFEPATTELWLGALPTELALWLKLDRRAGFESASELAGSRVSPPAAVRPGTPLPSSRRFDSGQYRPPSMDGPENKKAFRGSLPGRLVAPKRSANEP